MNPRIADIATSMLREFSARMTACASAIYGHRVADSVAELRAAAAAILLAADEIENVEAHSREEIQ